MNEPAPSKKRWIFRPLSLFIIWGLFALLLILNGLYEAKRAKDNLYRLLADEGAAIIEGLTRSAQSSLNSLTALETMPEAALLMAYSPVNLLALEESVIDWVLEIAFQIDQKLGPEPIGAERLAEVGRKRRLRRSRSSTGQNHFAFHRQTGISPRESQPPFYQGLTQGKASYAILRCGKAGHRPDGFSLGGNPAESGRRDPRPAGGRDGYPASPPAGRFAGDDRRMGRKGGYPVPSLSREGRGGLGGFRFPGGAEKRGKRRRIGGPPRSFRDPSGSRSGKGVFEVTQTVSLDPNSQGFLRVGLNTEKVDQIIAGDVRNLVLFSFFLLAFGGIGIVLIYRLENRHLARVREMEERIHRSEKLSSLANLAAGVAHEIRNPLNAIGMAIQRLQREFPQKTPELQEEYFRFTDVLRGEVKRVNEIIEQFLFFARPARLNLQPLPVERSFPGPFDSP